MTTAKNMKIYVSHSRNHDYERELYEPLSKLEAEFFLPHHGANETVKTKDVIESSDFVLAEVSYPATGSGIELGWASAADVEIICVHKTAQSYSGSLQFISSTFIEYSNSDELVQKLRKKLGI